MKKYFNVKLDTTNLSRWSGTEYASKDEEEARREFLRLKEVYKGQRFSAILHLSEVTFGGVSMLEEAMYVPAIGDWLEK